MQRTPSTTLHGALSNFFYSSLSLRCLVDVWGMSGMCFKLSERCLDMSGRCNVLQKVSVGFLNKFSFNVVRCPHPYCFPINKLCAVSPLPVYVFSLRCPHHPPCSSLPLLPLALSWILSKVENLANSSLEDEAIYWLFVHFACTCMCQRNLSTLILGPSLIINLAQLASSSVALLAELVFITSLQLRHEVCFTYTTCLELLHQNSFPIISLFELHH